MHVNGKTAVRCLL